MEEWIERVMLTKRNKVGRMTIVNTLLTGIYEELLYEELLKGEPDDIDGLLQIAVYAQVEMNRIVFKLNQLNGFLDAYCEHQIYDRNPDGTINIVECGYEPKDEPQTNADQHVQRVEYVENDERSRCWKCKHFERMHETPISSDGKYYTYVVCTAKECNYVNTR